MSYEDYFDSPIPTYENDYRLAALTFALLSGAAVVSVALIIWSVMVA